MANGDSALPGEYGRVTRHLPAPPIDPAGQPRPGVFGLLDGAGMAAILLLCANIVPPHSSERPEMLMLLLVAGAVLEALAPSRCRTGSGWPALALATGFPTLGTSWLLSVHLALRSLIDMAARGLHPREALRQLGRALPVVAAIAVAHHLPPVKGLAIGLPIFLGLTFALEPRELRGRLLRRAAEELLWFALLLWSSTFGLWPLLASLVALIAVYSGREVSDQDLQLSLSRQMTSTESTLRASQRKFQEDKGRFQNLISLQQILDDFQGQALRAESSQGLALPLLEAVSGMDERCQAGVCLAQKEEELALIAGSRRFNLTNFQPLPTGWRAGQMLRSADGKRCFYALGGGLFFLMESGLEAERRAQQDEFIEQLLVRARLILRILEQKRQLAGLLDEKTQALTQLADSQAQLLQSEKLAAIGQLAAGVAHEINSPLAAIHLQAQMARRRLNKNDTAGVLRSLETCEQASLRAKAIIESLLAYSQFSDGAREWVLLSDVVTQTTQMLEAHFEEGQVALKVVVGELAPLWGNSQELGQILTNILLNAVDALKERESDRRIMISVQDLARGEQSLLVANNGPLLAEDVIERLFDPFFTTKEIGSGTGLGLSIAYQLARGHGGSIVAANHNGWVHFTLTVPLKGPEATTTSAEPTR